MKRQHSARKKGTLVVVGGHEDKEGDCVILRQIAKLLKGGHLVIATIATQEPKDYFDTYEKVFRDLGVKHVTEFYLNDRAESLDPEKLRALDKASGLFFTGGDQLRISSQLGDTLFETRVREIYHQGGVVAGTSAGASAMAETMLIKGSNAESYKIGGLHLAPGLGLMPNVIIDQHFAERGRIGRLMGAIALNPRILGIGIDEDTAILKRDNKFSVIGSGAVYVADGSDFIYSNIAEAEPESILSLFGVRLHVLSSGDQFDLSKRVPIQAKTPRAAKKP
jgi:cyanophycinase